MNKLGDRIKPGYITQHFPIVLEKHGLRHIRFHDLRHSCASLLLANGVSLKEIQEWLGHSHYSTTANIYAHLDYSSKVSSAQVMSNTLQIPIMQKAPEPSQGQFKSFFFVKVMRSRGLEPPRLLHHWHLKPARLPIPPRPHILLTKRILTRPDKQSQDYPAQSEAYDSSLLIPSL
ncbi:MAG: site-specific integrase [Paenibacillus sp.]|nr:site-specific integrase [Paenibacillus sp.]